MKHREVRAVICIVFLGILFTACVKNGSTGLDKSVSTTDIISGGSDDTTNNTANDNNNVLANMCGVINYNNKTVFTIENGETRQIAFYEGEEFKYYDMVKSEFKLDGYIDPIVFYYYIHDNRVYAQRDMVESYRGPQFTPIFGDEANCICEFGDDIAIINVEEQTASPIESLLEGYKVKELFMSNNKNNRLLLLEGNTDASSKVVFYDYSNQKYTELSDTISSFIGGNDYTSCSFFLTDDDKVDVIYINKELIINPLNDTVEEEHEFDEIKDLFDCYLSKQNNSYCIRSKEKNITLEIPSISQLNNYSILFNSGERIIIRSQDDNKQWLVDYNNKTVSEFVDIDLQDLFSFSLGDVMIYGTKEYLSDSTTPVDYKYRIYKFE